MSNFIKTWNIEEETGYKPMTTVYEDFSIAEKFINISYDDPIADTYNRLKKEFSNNHKYFTELVMALNWKIWEHYDSNNEHLAKKYDLLFRNAVDYVYNNFTNQELEYYYRITD